MPRNRRNPIWNWDLCNRRGYTLTELLVTLIVSAIAVSLIFATYTVVLRVWNRYNIRVEVGNTAWMSYNRVQSLISKAAWMKKVSDTLWIAGIGSSQPMNLSFRDSGIVLQDSVVRWRAEADSFSLTCSDTLGSIWECAIICKNGKERAAIVWRTVCNGMWNDTLLPEMVTAKNKE